jgi:hypothetical protein
MQMVEHLPRMRKGGRQHLPHPLSDLLFLNFVARRQDFWRGASIVQNGESSSLQPTVYGLRGRPDLAPSNER